MERLTKLQILEETIAYYSEDINRRALIDTLCVYNTGDGRHCAVGRCFTDEVKAQGKDFEYNSGKGVDAFDFQSLLQEQYKGHETIFWRRLQKLHDSINSNYWGENGLTEEGKLAVESIKRNFDLVE